MATRDFMGGRWIYCALGFVTVCLPAACAGAGDATDDDANMLGTGSGTESAAPNTTAPSGTGDPIATQTAMASTTTPTPPATTLPPVEPVEPSPVESGGIGGQENTAGSEGVTAGSSSGGSPGLGGAGSGGTLEGPDTPSGAFFPAVPNVWEAPEAGENPGIVVLAHNAREGGLLGTEWLVSMRNDSDLTFCAVDMKYTFYDANDVELATGSQLVQAPLYRGSSGTGSLLQCLGPGDVGMLNDMLVLNEVDVASIARVTNYLGGIGLIDAVPTTDIAVTGITVLEDPFGNVLTGTLENNASTLVSNPSVVIFGLNAAGMPLFATEDIELLDISPGGSWAFTTNPSFEESFVTTAAFPKVSD